MADSLQPPSGSREQRLAYNEDFCRTLNERKAEWINAGQSSAGFRCECGEMDCGVRIQLSGEEWKQARSRPNRFAVAPDHFAPDIEAVIEKHPHFWLVEKRGEAGEVAKKLAE
jgi:hypothetical protein